MRPRIRRTDWPRPALILTDTPRPDCSDCRGEGGWNRDYGDPMTGEYAGSDWDPCPCWDENRRWLLVPVPRLPRREQPYTDPWATTHHNDTPF
ncbi:hypothetical protein ABZ990_09905 [Streptomyces sp. NPDC046203]|uniref:hypothetical protein n=1 Tax=Streptomyces sp. NPDC046203 TaxID=3154602 RepID=UPI0033C1414B